MSAVREYLNAQAAASRCAVPARSRRGIHTTHDPRQLVLFQYAGNEYSVIGVAYGRPGHRPDHVITCDDPLDRVGVAVALEPIRDDLLAWLAAHSVVLTTNPRKRREEAVAEEAPQLFVAGAGVLTALDNLAYDWRFNDLLDPVWATLGEELWTLCDLARRGRPALVVPYAETLAGHYAFGLSTLETAKLSVLVELLDADSSSGATLLDLREAERAESGPLGRPEEIDAPVWEAVRTGRRMPPQVRMVLGDTWDRCNRAHHHLTSLPEAAWAVDAAATSTMAWARRIHAARTGSIYRQRRAMPVLASAATELGWLEQDHEKYLAVAALEDPLYAAELAGDGKAVRADLTFTTRRDGRSTVVDIEAVTTDALVPPARGALFALSGLNGALVKTLVTAVTSVPGNQWRFRAYVDGKTTGGVLAARNLEDGPYWLVPAPRQGPPPMAAPDRAPATHPLARGRNR